MLTSVEDVLNRLGSDSRGVQYYLHLLNLIWSPAGQEYDLRRYMELALELKNNPEVIRALIESHWRPNLIGNAVVILLRASEFEADLCSRLIHGTWVAPQVAVGIALVSTGSSISRLEEFLESTSSDIYPKMPLSAYAALKYMNWNKASEFENTALFRSLTLRDEENCLRIAAEHWDFWKDIKVDPK